MLGAALAVPPVEQLVDLIDGVLGHGPVGRELAAGDRDDTRAGDADAVTAREVGGAFLGGGAEQRAQSGPRCGDVRFGEWRDQRAIDGAQEICHVVGRALRIVDVAVVIGVGGADVRVLPPRHDEDRAFVAGDRNHHRDLVLHLVPRHRDVHAFGRPERRGMRSFIERTHFVGPNPARVHHDPRRDLDVASTGGSVVGVNAHTRHASRRRLQHRDGGRVVHDDRAVFGCGPRECEREAGVVGVGVEVQVRRRKHVRSQRRHLGERVLA